MKLTQEVIDKIQEAMLHTKMYGDINFEYPVNPRVETTDELKSWGSFREDTLPIIKIAELAPEAQKIIDRVGW